MKKYFFLGLIGILALSCEKEVVEEINSNSSSEVETLHFESDNEVQGHEKQLYDRMCFEAETAIETGELYIADRAIWSSPDNENNPFDLVGSVHNDALEYIKDNAGEETDPALYTELSLAYISTETELPNILEFDQVLEGSANWEVATTKSGFNEFLLNRKNTAGDVTFFELAVFDLVYTVGESITNQNIRTVLFKVFENLIVASSIGDAPKRHLLIGISAAKHSSFFWDKEIEDVDLKIGKGWKIAAADVVGVLTGIFLSSDSTGPPGSSGLQNDAAAGASVGATASGLAAAGLCGE